MKKIVIKIPILIIIFCIMISLLGVRSNAAYIDLSWRVYGEDKNGDYLFNKVNGKTSVLYEFQSKIDNPEGMKKSYSFDAENDQYSKISNDGKVLLVYYNWLHAVNGLTKYTTKNSSYKNFSETNKQTVNDAIKGLKMARNEIGSFVGADNEITDGSVQFRIKVFTTNIGQKDGAMETQFSALRSAKAFKTIVDSNMPEINSVEYDQGGEKAKQAAEVISNFDKKIYNTICLFNAVNDYKAKKGSNPNVSIYVEDDYKTKFKYTDYEAKSYSNYYSLDILGENLTSKEQELIKKCWGAKAKAKDAGYPNVATDKSIYVDSSDSTEAKKKYSKDQIWLYSQVFGKNVGDDVIVAWANTIEGEKKYTDKDSTSLNNAKNTVNKIENVVAAGLDVINGLTDKVINITSTTETDSSSIASAGAEDAKTFKLFAEQYRLPNKTGSENGDENTTDIDTIVDSADSFINKGEEGKISEESIKSLSDSIYNILLIVGIILAVLIGAILGIKFMVGSVEQQADVKKLLVPYIVGCVVIFGSFGIWKLVVTMLASI